MKIDNREACILHANCQGDPLALLLEQSEEFAARWQIRTYTSYTRELIPASSLKKATLFLYQYMDSKWGDVSSEVLLSQLNPQAVPVCIPNMFFHGYWPFWYRKQPMAFADFYLDKLIDSGAAKPEILSIYLHGKVDKVVDFDEVVRETQRQEREKEARCDVKTTDFVEENWRKTRLFQTVNHPDVPLLIHAAQGILSHLGLPPLPDDVCGNFTFAYEGFELPIHPKVAEHHRLPFAGEETEYPVFGRTLNFARYISRYIECRLNGLDENFLGYLQLV